MRKWHRLRQNSELIGGSVSLHTAYWNSYDQRCSGHVCDFVEFLLYQVMNTVYIGYKFVWLVMEANRRERLSDFQTLQIFEKGNEHDILSEFCIEIKEEMKKLYKP